LYSMLIPVLCGERLRIPFVDDVARSR
jgi:hypothetical protein